VVDESGRLMGRWEVGHSVGERWIRCSGLGFWSCMSYLTCPRCRLSIHVRAPYLMLRNCPRCLGRVGLPTPMYVSSGPRLTAPIEAGGAGDGGQLQAR
jgi:hypothetical protein